MLRRITLLALLLLSLLALVSRLLSGAGIPDTLATTGPLPNTAFGTMSYVGMADIGLHVWEFKDPSCPGPIRVLMLPLSDEADAVFEFLRQPGEGITYWYGGTIYEHAARESWLLDFAIERLRSRLHARNSLPNEYFYLVIFHPGTCEPPPTADWPKLVGAIYP